MRESSFGKGPPPFARVHGEPPLREGWRGGYPSSVVSEEPPALRVAVEEVLGELDAVGHSTPISELFHRVWSVLPADQELVDVSPDEPVGVAFAKMAEHDFSQLPVRAGEQVLGVFSYRSFACRSADQIKLMPRTAMTDMPVDGFVDRPVFMSPYNELPDMFAVLDTEDAVFVGDERHLLGVVTTVDVLRWLHELAEPFVRLGEIERSLREIVRRKLSPTDITSCARATLHRKYRERPDGLPTVVEDMTFDELRLLVIDGRNWPLLEPALGRNLEMAKAKLVRLPALRNDVFHFRRELEAADRAAILMAREWLLGRLRVLDEVAES